MRLCSRKLFPAPVPLLSLFFLLILSLQLGPSKACAKDLSFQKLLSPAQKTLLNNMNFFEMDEAFFQKVVPSSTSPWFILFYAHWCVHCRKIAPNWKTFAQEMPGEDRPKISLAAVDW